MPDTDPVIEPTPPTPATGSNGGAVLDRFDVLAAGTGAGEDPEDEPPEPEPEPEPEPGPEPEPAVRAAGRRPCPGEIGRAHV